LKSLDFFLDVGVEGILPSQMEHLLSFFKFLDIFLQYKHIKSTNGRLTKMLMIDKDSVLKPRHELRI
jgi:hypothetical protein